MERDSTSCLAGDLWQFFDVDPAHSSDLENGSRTFFSVLSLAMARSRNRRRRILCRLVHANDQPTPELAIAQHSSISACDCVQFVGQRTNGLASAVRPRRT